MHPVYMYKHLPYKHTNAWKASDQLEGGELKLMGDVLLNVKTTPILQYSTTGHCETKLKVKEDQFVKLGARPKRTKTLL